MRVWDAEVAHAMESTCVRVRNAQYGCEKVGFLQIVIFNPFKVIL